MLARFAVGYALRQHDGQVADLVPVFDAAAKHMPPTSRIEVGREVVERLPQLPSHEQVGWREILKTLEAAKT